MKKEVIKYSALTFAILVLAGVLAFRNLAPPTTTLSFQTRSDLQLYTLQNGQLCNTAGTTTIGDSPVRTYYYDATSLATHDGINVIRPNSISPGDPGRYLMIMREQLQPDWNQASSGAADFIKNKPSIFSGTWADLSGKPSTFTPSSHTHPYSDITSAPWLTSEVDASISNEIQTLSLVGGSLSISGGNSVSLPSSPGNNNATGYGSGTGYTLTVTSAKVDFVTTDPVITLPAAGTYLILPNIKLEYVGLTLAVTRTADFKVRRTNNTAADITNATSSFRAPAIALAQNGTAGDVDIQPVIYTTSNSNDVLEIWGSISGATLTGTMLVGEASIIAIRIY